MAKRAKAKSAAKTRIKMQDLKSRKDVKGGKTPASGGPAPIPYPN